MRLNATGVCYSDIHYMLADLPSRKMSQWGVRSPGHEGAGVVVKLGSRVKDWGLGDRAGIKPIWDTCQNCELCWGTMETHCPKAISSGVMVPGKCIWGCSIGLENGNSETDCYRYISAICHESRQVRFEDS